MSITSKQISMVSVFPLQHCNLKIFFNYQLMWCGDHHQNQHTSTISFFMSECWTLWMDGTSSAIRWRCVLAIENDVTCHHVHFSYVARTCHNHSKHQQLSHRNNLSVIQFLLCHLILCLPSSFCDSLMGVLLLSWLQVVTKCPEPSHLRNTWLSPILLSTQYCSLMMDFGDNEEVISLVPLWPTHPVRHHDSADNGGEVYLGNLMNATTKNASMGIQ